MSSVVDGPDSLSSEPVCFSCVHFFYTEPDGFTHPKGVQTYMGLVKS